MNIVPFPEYDENLETLQEVYKNAMLKMAQMVENADPNNLLQASLYESLLSQHAFILNELNEESSQIVEDSLRTAYEAGQLNAMVSLGIASTLVEASRGTGFSLVNRNRIDAMVRDTFKDVLKANSIMGEEIKKKIRDIEAQVMRENIALQRGTVTSAKDLKQRFIDAGFSKSLVDDSWKGITDAGGRRWDLSTYTHMLARTKLQQAQIEGVRTFSEEHNDHDLAIVSSHGAKDACRHFEGMIISLSGKTAGYKTLRELKSSGLIFHPNCQHSVHAIGDLDILPEKLKEKAKQAERSATKALKNPAEMKREDNQGRYMKKKADKEKKIAQKKERLEKARETRKAKKERAEKVPFKAEDTRLYNETKRDLYIGNKLIDDSTYSQNAVRELFGDKITKEGFLNAFNPDPSKYTVKLERLKIREGNGNPNAEVWATIKDGDKKIATVQRTMLKANGALYVKNDLLEFNKSVQGAGLATSIYFKSEVLYKEMAQGKPINISLYANLDVGLYAWTRHGFDFKSVETMKDFQYYLRSRIERDLDDELYEGKHGQLGIKDWKVKKAELFDKKIKSFGYDKIEDIVHSWQFGALDDGEVYDISQTKIRGHFGKKFMLEKGEAWDGIKKLNQGHDSELIGNLYFENKGVK